MAAVYCSTSGTILESETELREHYRSELHRYNLKRKAAGLPPVTLEWFEARKAQLAAASGQAALEAVPLGHVRVWFDPLTRKTFRTEQTYQALIRSNKYQDLVRKSGEPAPSPVVSVRKIESEQQTAGPMAVNAAAPREGQLPAAPGFLVLPPSRGVRSLQADKAGAEPEAEAEDEEDEDGWETASDDEQEELQAAMHGVSLNPVAGGWSATRQAQQQQKQSASQQGPGEEVEAREVAEGAEGEQQDGVVVEWDVCRSLLDNHVSRSFEANLEYMWRNYGFHLPDAEYLKDPEGLIKYLGAKLTEGRVPLYTRGDDPAAKQFRSMHAVQRHMVDSGRCKMLYEDNEEEYTEFYDYEDEEVEGQQGGELALSAPEPAQVMLGGFELYVPKSTGGGKVLGSREFARFYRQKHKNPEGRQMVLVNTMLAKYRSLGISLRDDAVSLAKKKAKTKTIMDLNWAGKKANLLFLRGNVNRNLPKNVPY